MIHCGPSRIRRRPPERYTPCIANVRENDHETRPCKRAAMEGHLRCKTHHEALYGKPEARKPKYFIEKLYRNIQDREARYGWRQPRCVYDRCFDTYDEAWTFARLTAKVLWKPHSEYGRPVSLTVGRYYEPPKK